MAENVHDAQRRREDATGGGAARSGAGGVLVLRCPQKPTGVETDGLRNSDVGRCPRDQSLRTSSTSDAGPLESRSLLLQSRPVQIRPAHDGQGAQGQRQRGRVR